MVISGEWGVKGLAEHICDVWKEVFSCDLDIDIISLMAKSK